MRAYGVVMAAIICCTLGCGGGGYPVDPNMVKISGVVTIDGEPTQYVQVVLVPERIVQATKARGMQIVNGPNGITDEKGAFSIMSMRPNDGILPGDYIMVFQWNPQPTPEDLASGVPLEEALLRSYPKLAAFREKYGVGQPGNIPFKVEAKKPQKDLKFDLTTK